MPVVTGQWRKRFPKKKNVLRQEQKREGVTDGESDDDEGELISL